MIFLSASIPRLGREYYGTENIPAIREAVMAFTKVCIEYKIPFYFGGHPAISPLVYQIAKDYDADFASNVKIYQSEWFKGQTPPEVDYYYNIVWTGKLEELKPSLELMRLIMLSNPTECAVFIGGMDGIIEEAKMVHKLHPQAQILAVTNTGGASAGLIKRTGLKYDTFPDSYAYVSLFREYLKQFKK